MKTKLVNLYDYLLLVDEEGEILNGSYFLLGGRFINIYQGNNEVRYKTSLSQKIIAYYPLTKKAKELDLPLLPNPFKKESWIEIDKIVGDILNTMLAHADKDSILFTISNKVLRTLISSGYKEAKSKQFSLEDIKRAIEMARETKDLSYREEGGSFVSLGEYQKYSQKQIIKSLSTQQLPKEFSVMKTKIGGCKTCGINIPCQDIEYNSNCNFKWTEELKTIINSKGKQELVGVYKY